MSFSRKAKGISTTAIVAIIAVILVVAGLAWYFTLPPAPLPGPKNPFADARARRAVAAALDRSAVCNTVFLGQAKPLYSIIPEGMFGHSEAFKALGDANYVLTRTLLSELGYNETNKLEIDLWYESSGHYPSSADQALFYKASLEASGVIKVNLKSADWPSYRANRNNEIMQVYIYGWYPDYIDPDDYSFLYWATWLHHHYGGAEMKPLYDQARATMDAAERERLYAKIDELAVRDCPVVPIFSVTPYAVTKPDIEGVVLDVTMNWHLWLLETAGNKDTLIWGTTDSVEYTLDPAQAYDYFGWCMIMNLGATLVEIRPGSAAGPEDFIPALATDWSHSNDMKTWTFNLRHGVEFEDGTEFNATHVKYSFDRSMGIAYEEGAQVGIGYSDIIDSVEVTGTYQVVFHLKVPFVPFLGLLACQASSIVNPKYAPKDSLVEYVEGDARASNPNDLGRYRLTKWERVAGKDVELRLEANPNYWNATEGWPKTKNIIIKMYSDATALRLAIEAGDVDIAFRHLIATDIVDLQDNPAVKVWKGFGAQIQYLVFQEKESMGS